MTTESAVLVQLFPYSADAVVNPSRPCVKFPPFERLLVPGTHLRIGRKVDPSKSKLKKSSLPTVPDLIEPAAPQSNLSASLGTSSEPHPHLAANINVDLSTSPAAGGLVGAASTSPGWTGANMPSAATKEQSDESENMVAFRSKVVSRDHAELWLDYDGKVYLRDRGSSSGTFLNRLRLSASSKESNPYPLKSNDVIQLGVDYQGRQEDIYRAIGIKVFISAKINKPMGDPYRLRVALAALVGAMGNSHSVSDACTECCICISNLNPGQALFLAPCSHCFHYKCVIPLVDNGYMFQCPLCRQVANLDAAVGADDDVPQITDSSVQEVLGLSQPGSHPAALSAAGPIPSPPSERAPSSYAAQQAMDLSTHSPSPDSEEVEGAEVTNATRSLAIEIPNAARSALRSEMSPSTPLSSEILNGNMGSHRNTFVPPATLLSQSLSDRRSEDSQRSGIFGGLATSLRRNRSGRNESLGRPVPSPSAPTRLERKLTRVIAETLASSPPDILAKFVQENGDLLEEIFEEFPDLFSQQRRILLRDMVEEAELSHPHALNAMAATQSPPVATSSQSPSGSASLSRSLSPQAAHIRTPSNLGLVQRAKSMLKGKSNGGDSSL
ncbi:uncharacterized protein BJ171DRAFT_518934 [Polychytrium aggregatum]|uniref:uncharacterized protein n=1 Tax=Polychytrium aggregatum TaxID=110093 RepID=UPI0022FDCDA8|nr:uncharacterized protein BJ171DRAFT_518934 [Polychytrium aggregatum]KAI9199371.1 hypothetical protein BJ171DRAFT_518934 [Polychytrium aggregatum]